MAKREALVRESELVISLIPAALHVGVAQLAIRHQKHMVTASYVNEDMQALDGEARASGVLILNEVGLDPGIDHMSAMKMIDEATAKGGRVTRFTSLCGGLPAPEAAGSNPLGYKFSWSPKGVLLAAQNAAQFRENGRLQHIPGTELLTHSRPLTLNNAFALDVLPNRDSTAFANLYGLADAPSFFRGTLRYHGFCERMQALVQLGLLEQGPRPELKELATSGRPCSCRQWFAQCLGVGEAEGDLRAAVRTRLCADSAGLGIEFVTWLGLLSNMPVPKSAGIDSPIDVVAKLLQREDMSYLPGERDMVIMHHLLEVEYDGGQRESRTATLIEYGAPGGATAMAKTVGLTAAIAAQLILDDPGRFGVGVQRPLRSEWYTPVLELLAREGIRLEERVDVEKGVQANVRGVGTAHGAQPVLAAKL